MAEQAVFVGIDNVRTVVNKLKSNIVLGPAWKMRGELDRLGIHVETDVQNMLTYTVFNGKGGETRRKVVGDVKEVKLGYFFERQIKTEICIHRVRVNKDQLKEKPANFAIDGSAAPSFPNIEMFVNEQAKVFSKDVFNCVANGKRTEEGTKLGMFDGVNEVISNDINDGVVNLAAKNLVVTSGTFDAPQTEGDSQAYQDYVDWEQGWSEELQEEDDVLVYVPVKVGTAIKDAYEQKHRSHSAAITLENGNFKLPDHPNRTFVPWNRLKGTRIFATLRDNIILAVGNTSEDAVVDIEKDPSHDTTEMVFQIQSPFGVGIKDPSARAFVTNGGVTEDVFFSGDYTKDGVYVTSNDTELGTVAIKNGETAVQSGEEFVKGTTLTLTATPATGKVFKKWSNGQTDATISVVTTGDPMYFTAIFAGE